MHSILPFHSPWCLLQKGCFHRAGMQREKRKFDPPMQDDAFWPSEHLTVANRLQSCTYTDIERAKSPFLPRIYIICCDLSGQSAFYLFDRLYTNTIWINKQNKTKVKKWFIWVCFSCFVSPPLWTATTATTTITTCVPGPACAANTGILVASSRAQCWPITAWTLPSCPVIAIRLASGWTIVAGIIKNIAQVIK